ncbi:MAG: sigma-54 dependent transcriptional regulator [Pseudomonadota bacterium]
MDKQTILVVEDDADLADALITTLDNAGYETLYAADGGAALQLAEQYDFHLVLSDVQMQPMDGLSLLQALQERFPGVAVVLMTAYASVPKAVEAMRLGAQTYLVKPFEADELVDTIERCLARRRSMAVTSVETGAVVCGDPNTVNLLAIASRVAGCDATVLLSGESGTGKEVFARFIHNNSLRADEPFVAINCAAIPEQMLEATLFGYEKGAYTGALAAHPGKFEQANGGTILLDEISEMDLALQAKLLRVLQEREVERLGSKCSITLNVRVLATTNRNLAAEVEAGRFREDLYYRLNVFPLHIPPLRERRGDVLPLFVHMLKRYCDGQRALPRLTLPAERELLQHAWPGNVRELENVVQRSLILLAGDQVSVADLAFESQTSTTALPEVNAPARPAPLQDDLRATEQRLILDALKTGAGNRQAAARALGISARTLRYKIARLREAGLPIPDKNQHTHDSASIAQGAQ